ncbi:MAG: hypothetical protein POG74_09795 [Acidocella sp.]|nr:hypothetical protein [Acidocella sp.]
MSVSNSASSSIELAAGGWLTPRRARLVGALATAGWSSWSWILPASADDDAAFLPSHDF